MRPVGSYTFTQAGAGHERGFTLDAEVTGLKKLFMSGPEQKSMDGEMATLDNAKALLERWARLTRRPSFRRPLRQKALHNTRQRTLTVTATASDGNRP